MSAAQILRLIVLMSLVSWISVASHADDQTVRQLFRSNQETHVYRTDITESLLKTIRPWNPKEANPPLSARDAMARAIRFFPPEFGNAEDWAQGGLKLYPLRVDNKWWWIARFSRLRHQANRRESTLNLVILFDGRVLTPVREPEADWYYIKGRLTQTF